MNSLYIKIVLIVFSTLFSTVVLSQNDEITTLLNKAKGYVDSKDYTRAKYELNKALKLSPDNQNVKNELDNVERLIVKQKEERKKLEGYLKTAEGQFRAKDYKNAKITYKQILQIDPKNRFANDRLKQIAKVYTDPDEEAAYQNALKTGNNFLSLEKYQDAIKAYEGALVIKPNDRVASDKIAEAKDMEAAGQRLTKLFDEMMAKGKEAENAKNYGQAVSAYQKALKYKSQNPLAQESLTRVQELFKQAQEKDSQYKKFIDLADNQYIERKFQAAKENYQKALNLKPDEAYPQSMLDKIAPALAKQASEQEAYNKLITDADALFLSKKYEEALPLYEQAQAHSLADAYPKSKVEEINTLLQSIADRSAKYKDLINRGDSLFQAKLLRDAQKNYQTAADLMPEEGYPKTKVSEIERLLAAQKKLDDDYLSFINEASQYFSEKKWQKAKQAYQKAKELKPEEDLADKKIQEIDEVLLNLKRADEAYAENIKLADKAFLEKKYEEAQDLYTKSLNFKSEDKHALNKLDEIKGILAEKNRIDKAFNALLDESDRLKNSGDYKPAIEKLDQALTLKPEALETVNQRKEVLLELINEYEVKMTQLKMKTAAYAKAISSADSLYDLKLFAEAKVEYSKALEAKADEDYPKKKIQEIDTFIKDSNLKEEQFASKVQEAEKAYADQDFVNSLKFYKAAAELKPENKSVQEKIEALTTLLADKEEREQQIAALRKEADAFYDKQEWQSALNNYKELQQLKADDEEVRLRLSKLLDLIEDEKQNENLYQEAIRKADLFFKQEKYFKAKENYENASKIKPKESYPVTQINTIDERLRERESLYNGIIAEADSLSNLELYKDAKQKYEAALLIKSDDEYAKQMLKKVNHSLEKIRVLMLEKYGEAIRMADSYYNSGFYDEAIPKYKEAHEINPSDPYPEAQIEMILNYLKEHVVKEFITDSLVLMHDQEKIFRYNKIESSILKNSYLVVKLVNKDDSNVRLYISYGKDGVKSGGVVLKNIASGEGEEYLIRISMQERWNAIDNNYIQLYAEGGVVSINSFVITRGK